MLFVDKNGLIDAERIIVKRFITIERAKMAKVNGIVVHQTGGSSAASAFSSYSNDGANGAHFLIDLDGTIYQTASLYRVTNHVGRVKSRCVITKKCAPTEFKRMMDLEKAWKPTKISKIEYKKQFPERYPVNVDAVGIEIVGDAKKVEGQREEVYVSVNDKQNESLKWLVRELADTLNVSMDEVYRHPDIGRKTPTEASTAKW